MDKKYLIPIAVGVGVILLVLLAVALFSNGQSEGAGAVAVAAAAGAAEAERRRRAAKKELDDNAKEAEDSNERLDKLGKVEVNTGDKTPLGDLINEENRRA
jgi:hypothetical protein